MQMNTLLRAGSAIALFAGALPARAVQSNYTALSDPGREVVNFNVETVRGMVVHGTKLFAINTHASRLVVFTSLDDPDPFSSFPTLHNPVAINAWSTGDRILVAGGATHALAIHNPSTGVIEDVLDLARTDLPFPSGSKMGSEPGDLLVVGSVAFVSCMGSNEVVSVLLGGGGSNPATLTQIRRYSIPSQRPRFLSSIGNRVFVAPFVSGNNTTVDTSKEPSEVMNVPGLGLPDQDLFELLPNGGVLPSVRGVGHLILDHGVDSATNPNPNFYVLSINPENNNPAAQSEPSLKGDFAEQRMTKIPVSTLPTAIGQAPVQVQASMQIDLDDALPMPDKQYAEATSCSFPFSLAFDNDATTPRIFVAGSTSDRVLVLNPTNGLRIGRIDLPPGSIPRDLQFYENVPSSQGLTDVLLVYNWGTNLLSVFDADDIDDNPATPDDLIVDYELGLDPTPASVKAGREIWYDATRSENGRSSCNTCHPGGSSDFLGWPLTGHPLDDKDVMVTQTLLSIEDTFPYHWRGERELRDFNGAFAGLLGGSALNPTEFEQFQEFVFSLQAPRNPNQDVHRVLGPSAFSGQTTYTTKTSAGPFACNRCHLLPTGALGDMTGDVVNLIPTNIQFDTPSLRMLYNRNAGKTTVTGVGEFPLLGFGISHDGDNFDVLNFITNPFGFDLNPTEEANIDAFIREFDQGIAPAAQLAWHLGPGPNPNLSTVMTIQDLLLTPAVTQGWLDVCAFGRVAGTHVHWLYDPDTNLFVADDGSIDIGATAGVATFQELQNLVEHKVFLGLPPGSGRVFALDQDNDGLDRGQELAPTVALDPDLPDWDGDSFPDGYEVAHQTDPKDNLSVPNSPTNDPDAPTLAPGSGVMLRTSARTATYRLAFDEPTTYTLTATRSGMLPIERKRLDPVLEDTITIQELLPSSQSFKVEPNGLTWAGLNSTYSVSIVMTDLVGNESIAPVVLNPATTKQYLEPKLEESQGNGLLAPQQLTQVVKALGPASVSLAMNGQSTLLGAVDVVVPVTIGPRHETVGSSPLNPAVNKVLVARILKKDAEGKWQVIPAGQLGVNPNYSGTSSQPATGYTLSGQNLQIGVIVYTGQTSSSGQVDFAFRVTGLDQVNGDDLRLSIVGIFFPPAVQSGVPDFHAPSRTIWNMPSTPDDPQNLRSESFAYNP